MYAIKQTYTNTAHPKRNVVRVLKPHYKTERGANTAAKRFNWVCKRNNRVTESSIAKVINL